MFEWILKILFDNLYNLESFMLMIIVASKRASKGSPLLNSQMFVSIISVV